MSDGWLELDSEFVPMPPDDAVDSCPNIWLNGRLAHVWLGESLGWVNIHPGPPPDDGPCSIMACPAETQINLGFIRGALTPPEGPASP
jgi:hypothetical protein